MDSIAKGFAEPPQKQSPVQPANWTLPLATTCRQSAPRRSRRAARRRRRGWPPAVAIGAAAVPVATVHLGQTGVAPTEARRLGGAARALPVLATSRRDRVAVIARGEDGAAALAIAAASRGDHGAAVACRADVENSPAPLQHARWPGSPQGDPAAGETVSPSDAISKSIIVAGRWVDSYRYPGRLSKPALIWTPRFSTVSRAVVRSIRSSRIL